ncbi:ACL175Wp [Eremothecium gossypii ATCC 10895]|uniref:ACL175Wp n=1 Tax=Eremothecium gossypii (strain ATCC 10895 / CBS 109.51 / FGSC 9923 / NRRL Y-1056) TaxID=284811 RepID=Q75CU4_EREGS|nr:ACL175Wp [Eremothecium gossypii ATCC 10895]AAS51053.2 ACL175Wp [Eremothecium gossypii ATCC 10895]AEY95343.1 FACL175Wp [Eremothecium gossypii FDAG1]
MIFGPIVLFLVKRTPRLFALTFNAIAILLAVFVLLGCYNSQQQSTFLSRLQFNAQSPLYTVIEKSLHERTNTTGFEQLRIKVGYLGVCLSNLPAAYPGGPVQCFGRKNITGTPLYDALDLRVFNIPAAANSSSHTDLNILGLAHAAAADIDHPYIFMISIILAILMFCILLYVTVPMLPYKRPLNLALLGLSPLVVVFLAFGSMWTHVACNAASAFIPPASMGVIKVHRGRKATAMVWSCFVFVLLDCIIIWAIYFRDQARDKKSRGQADYERYANSDYAKYAQSDRSTLGNKY